ncbi:MAG: hypothetical protein Q9201_003335 [Fulgogasparrea decipioides]
MKFSGAGQSVTHQLLKRLPPSTIISEATTAICEDARAKGVRLLVDAEQYAMQNGIDQWTLDLQRKYNRDGLAVVYGTYQAYLRSTPATLARHLAIAQSEGFILGVKLVRGAYMASDPQHLFWGTKDETDRAYDGIAESLIRRKWNDILTLTNPEVGLSPAFPKCSLNLATHNHASVRKAMIIREEQLRTGYERIDLAYAQLMGMADEVGCELILAGRRYRRNGDAKTEEPRAYKYLAWGTVRDCLTYLLRRAEENRDTLARAKEDRVALGKELQRRILGL